MSRCQILIFCISLILLAIGNGTCLDTGSAGGGSYSNIKELQDFILSSAKYSTNLRPLKDQTQQIVIDIKFSLIALVSVDNVKQELITNGFLFLFWNDELNSWDPDDYGGVDRLTPTPSEIWRPKLLLINTLDKRDPFEDDYCYVEAEYTGRVGWVPGGLFKTYCALNMEKFPFDVQNCQIQMCPMSHTNITLRFEADDEINLSFYYPNPGWELLKAWVAVETITFRVQLKRRPTTIVLNVIIPVILLSVLNNLVFLIPVDSGEKISYGITVLLSLTVFLSMVSTMTPHVSDVVPALTIYLSVLLISSVLTVAAAIFSVWCHNLDEKEEFSIKNKFNFQTTVKRVVTINTAVAPLEKGKEPLPDVANDGPGSLHNTVMAPRHNPYRIIAKHVNKAFFIIMNGVTFVATVWYLAFTNS